MKRYQRIHAPLLAILFAVLTATAAAQNDTGQPTANGPAPPAPTGLTAADVPWDKGDAIALSWEAPEGASNIQFRIERQEIAPDAVAAGDWKFLDIVDGSTTTYTAKDLDHTLVYDFRVFTMADDGTLSTTAAQLPNAFAPLRQPFFGSRFYLLFIVLIFCGSVVYWIWHARSGRPIKVRQIAGLEAVDEAVGRATEMGRPCLYVPGIQDINEIQTIAGITILSRVARTAAEYDAKVEVPTARSLVMTTARETVQAAYLAAGRPDAYNQDLIYYVTDEQFGYVAYLQGMMVREKPAACFYMGAFYAESLILAETGNGIGAIQVAGTAMPAQLPFFVAACDYTLIGEEFFAASAYLSGSPEELGSLKGQDVGKVIVGIVLIIGVLLFTVASVTGSQQIMDIVDWLKGSVLT